MKYTEIEGDDSLIDSEPKHRKAAWEVIQELYSRAAFDHWWDNIYDDDKDELFDTLAKIIKRETEK